MKPVGIERNHSCRTQPARIVYAGRWQGVGYYRRGLGPRQVAPHLYGTYIPQLTAFCKVDGVLKMLLAALPLTHLHDFIIALLRFDHRLALVDRIADRFFAIHVLPCFTGM